MPAGAEGALWQSDEPLYFRCGFQPLCSSGFVLVDEPAQHVVATDG
jgi:hypothetical protein